MKLKYLLYSFSLILNLKSMDNLKVPGIALPKNVASDGDLKTNRQGKLFSKNVKYTRVDSCCGFDEYEFDIEIPSDNLTCFALKEIIVEKIKSSNYRCNNFDKIRILLNGTEMCSHVTDFKDKPFNFVNYTISVQSN